MKNYEIDYIYFIICYVIKNHRRCVAGDVQSRIELSIIYYAKKQHKLSAFLCNFLLHVAKLHLLIFYI